MGGFEPFPTLSAHDCYLRMAVVLAPSNVRSPLMRMDLRTAVGNSSARWSTKTRTDGGRPWL